MTAYRTARRPRRAELSDVEQRLIGSPATRRILFGALIGFVLSSATLRALREVGIDGVPAYVILFLLMNAAFFATCARYWARARLPIAPQGWRRGGRARFGIALLVVKASLWALLPWNAQLLIALIVVAAAV